MIDVKEILDMLDWNMPIQIQAKGIELAMKVETILPFIQPFTSMHNKSVWENCAIIIAARSDEELTPHLIKLLEWIQDLNWPGAILIKKRLIGYSDFLNLRNAINVCVTKAKSINDDIWQQNLLYLLDNR